MRSTEESTTDDDSHTTLDPCFQRKKDGGLDYQNLAILRDAATIIHEQYDKDKSCSLMCIDSALEEHHQAFEILIIAAEQVNLMDENISCLSI